MSGRREGECIFFPLLPRFCSGFRVFGGGDVGEVLDGDGGSNRRGPVSGHSFIETAV